MTTNRHGFEQGYDARKAQPIVTGCLDYFSLALLAVAEVSEDGNRQHNPGRPLQWAREKSRDELNTAVRHLLERGALDGSVRHLAKAAWRILAALQKEIEADACQDATCEVHHGDGADHGGSCPLLPRAATWYGRTRDHDQNVAQGETTLCESCSDRMIAARAAGKLGIVMCEACSKARLDAEWSGPGPRRHSTCAFCNAPPYTDCKQGCTNTERAAPASAYCAECTEKIECAADGVLTVLCDRCIKTVKARRVAQRAR